MFLKIFISSILQKYIEHVYMLFHLTLHVRRQMGGSRGGPPPSLHEMPIPFYIHWDRNIIVTLVLSLYRKIVGTTVSVLNKCRRTNCFGNICKWDERSGPWCWISVQCLIHSII